MNDLHLFQLRLRLPRLYSLAGQRGLPRRDVDLGYLVHCQLGELFREDPPKLFALPARHRPDEGTGISTLEVLGYSPVPAAEMLDRARRFATPERWAAFDELSLRSKPMPRTWEPGAQVGFEVRVCPIVRTRRSLKGEERLEKPQELDAFVAKRHDNFGTRLDRGEVYREWLAARFADAPGMDLMACRTVSMRREKLVRRTHTNERRSKVLERPEAVFRGRLRVGESAEFNRALAHGIGRHRAFGFGMLLLMPTSEAGC